MVFLIFIVKEVIMKRVRKVMKPIKANQELEYSYTFTAGELVMFLSQMVELSGCCISYEETPSGILNIFVDDSVYQIVDIG